MRLIDADRLKEYIQDAVKSKKGRDIDLVPVSEIPVLIDRQPTAYDVDKVVEQLEGKVKELESITAKMVLNKSQKAQNHGYYVAIEHAIDIVRSGGKEQE